MATKVGRTPRVPAHHSLVLLTTAGSPRQAEKLARLLLKEKCAACVNLIPNVRSCYWWKNRIEKSRETLLLIKTSKTRLHECARVLKNHHTYDLPEMIALSISWGDQVYLKWLKDSMTKRKTLGR